MGSGARLDFFLKPGAAWAMNAHRSPCASASLCAALAHAPLLPVLPLVRARRRDAVSKAFSSTRTLRVKGFGALLAGRNQLRRH